jgi:hypothetical protein
MIPPCKVPGVTLGFRPGPETGDAAALVAGVKVRVQADGA